MLDNIVKRSERKERNQKNKDFKKPNKCNFINMILWSMLNNTVKYSEKSVYIT